jgi:uncharacterized repeat protein (TIGR01451 family)
MKKIAALCLLLVLSSVLFLSPIATRLTHAAIASADLSVTKVDTPDPVNTGSNLTYTITVNNNGPDAASNASFSDTLPIGTTFADLSAANGWSCTVPERGDPGTVSCSNPSLAVGSSVFTLTVAVAPNFPAGSIISNTATAASNTPDANSNNNSGSANTTVLSPANITGTKSRSGGGSPGSTLTYLIILSNASNSDQQDNPGNELTDVLPGDLTLVSASASSGTATANIPANTVTWNGVVPARDSVTITIDATIKPGTEEHTIANQANISYDADGNGTNEASATTNIDSFGVGPTTLSADLSVTKNAPDTAPSDSDLTYTITVANLGPDTATSAKLTDALPGDMTFVSLLQPAGWNCNLLSPGSGGTLVCTRDLPAGSGPQIFTLVGHIPSGTQEGTFYNNMATVSTAATDSNSENDIGSAGTTVMCVGDPVVTTNADSGAGSLRRAIQDVCPGGTITFDPALLAGGSATITLTSGELLINKNLNIAGPGANLLTVQRSSAVGTPNFRIFNVTAGTVTIYGLTISNGNADQGGSGGGITNRGILTLLATTVSGNTSANTGGGIRNDGSNSSASLTLINSTVSGNHTSSSGAGIINIGFQGSATLNIINSTITGNSASSFGGGVYNDGNSGTANVTSINSTISGNTASSSGGGIYNFGNGGTGTLTLRNTIVSDNRALNAANGPDVFNFNGTVTGSNNIIQTSTGYAISGSNNLNVDPLLQKDGSNALVLKNNGGPPQTILLLPTSPAINAGNNANLPADTLDLDGDGNTAEQLPIDQRGFARVVANIVDIGAVEVSYAISATAGTPQSTIINSAFATALQATVSESGNPQNVSVTFTAPASGASGTFTGGATTAVVSASISGVATAPTFTANGTAGSYNVVASIGTGQPTALFALTNNRAATTTAVTSSVHPSNLNQSVTFTATVTSAAGTPTGTVQFKDNGTDLGSPVALNGSGVATFSTSTLVAGVHVISALYSGDANFLTSTGTLAVSQQVGSVVSFSSNTYNTTEGSGFTTITVVRSGDLSQAVSVDYATPDDSSAMTILPCSTANGIASSRCDFETALGTIRWAAGDNATKTFTVLINQDSFVEGPETLTLTLSNLTGGAGFPPPGATSQTATLTITDDVTEPATNPSDDTDTFVRQQYRDFLNREPDAAGLAFWKDNIDKCNDPARRPPGLTVPQCIALFRIQTSAAFFLSIEFQSTGYYVERTYKAGFDDISPPTVPVPVRFTDFLRDTEQIGAGVVVGQGNWQPQLDNNKSAYALTFVQRQAFLTRYPAGTSATVFVDSLNANAGNVLSDSERSALISELSPNPSDATLRAGVLRKVADNTTLQLREFNRAFVLAEYFGYLRRNPDAAPDLNFNGYNFWLSKLNQFNGNFEIAEMVKAFLASAEYRQRFGL